MEITLSKGEQKVIDALKGFGECGASIQDIAAKLGCSDRWPSSVFRKLRKNGYPNIAYQLHGHAYIYNYCEPEEIEETVETIDAKKLENKIMSNSFESPYKNAEKYNDPTAGKAIENVVKPAAEDVIIPGMIYTVTNGWNYTGLFLALVKTETTVIGYDVTRDYGVSTDNTVAWTVNDEHPGCRFVRTDRLTNRNYKTFKLEYAPDVTTERCPHDILKDIIGKSPLRNTHVVEVEKEVEKPVVSNKQLETIENFKKKIASLENENHKLHAIVDALPNNSGKLEQEIEVLKRQLDVYEMVYCDLVDILKGKKDC